MIAKPPYSEDTQRLLSLHSARM